MAIVSLRSLEFSLPFEFGVIVLEKWSQAADSPVPLVASVVWGKPKPLDIREEVLVGFEHAEASVFASEFIYFGLDDSISVSLGGLKEFPVERAKSGVRGVNA